MLVDWFTVGAEAFNFIILVWLMKRFLYKPVLRAVEVREKKIAAALADAAAKQAQALAERDTFQRKKDELDAQRDALLGQAAEEARNERQRLLDEARAAADALAVRRQEALEDDARRLNKALRLRTQQEVFAITRKVLADLAGARLEDQLGEAFARRLRTMDAAARGRLAAALSAAPEPAVVRSAFPLADEVHAAVRQALNETFAREVPVRFETVPDLIGGLEFATHGQKVSWSLADYLDALEQGVNELIEEHAGPAAPAEPAAAPAPPRGDHG